MRSADAVEGGSRQRAALEEEREFLLRSLRDLEAERAAGDIDEADYAALHDDYTARAAEVLRRLDALGEGAPGGGSRPAPAADAEPAGEAGEVAPEGEVAPAEHSDESRTRAGRTGGRRRLLWVATAVVVAVGIGIAAAVGSGVRLPGETITGAPTGTDAIDQRLLAAQKAVDAGSILTAVKDYQAILDTDATNPEALTGYGAILVETHKATLVARGVVMLAEAESADASYGPAYAYLGEGEVLLGDYAKAVKQLDTFVADDPSSALLGQAKKLLAYAKGKVAGGSSKAPAGSSGAGAK